MIYCIVFLFMISHLYFFIRNYSNFLNTIFNAKFQGFYELKKEQEKMLGFG